MTWCTSYVFLTENKTVVESCKHIGSVQFARDQTTYLNLLASLPASKTWFLSYIASRTLARIINSPVIESCRLVSMGFGVFPSQVTLFIVVKFVLFPKQKTKITVKPKARDKAKEEEQRTPLRCTRDSGCQTRPFPSCNEAGSASLILAERWTS